MSRQRGAPLTDSPWFWAIVFCAAGMMFLLAIWPQYAARQSRLEMQFLAQEEMVRRGKSGEPPARQPGQEGEAPPPVVGELIIPIWPLWLLLAALLAVSAFLLWQSRGKRAAPADQAEREEAG